MQKHKHVIGLRFYIRIYLKIKIWQFPSEPYPIHLKESPLNLHKKWSLLHTKPSYFPIIDSNTFSISSLDIVSAVKMILYPLLGTVILIPTHGHSSLGGA